MFRELLKDLRKKKGVTQTQLAKEIGVSVGNVGDWEIGKSKPGYNALAALSRFFDIGAGRLLELPEPNGLVCDGVPLSQAEADLVAMFRILGERDRETAFDFVTMLYEKASGEKGSIYSTYIDDEKERKKSGPDESREAQAGTA